MALTIAESTIVAAKDTVVSCDLADGAALLDLSKNMYYGINAVGAEIWTIIQSPTAVTQIDKAIRDKFEVGSATVLDDVVSILQEMAGADLIVLSDAQSR